MQITKNASKVDFRIGQYFKELFLYEKEAAARSSYKYDLFISDCSLVNFWW
jgi:hypothetical protein